MTEHHKPKHDKSNDHNNFHVPKYVGTSLGQGWDKKDEFLKKASFIIRNSPNDVRLP
jgi:hypothetical protein